jgi:hypothetical protein
MWTVILLTFSNIFMTFAWYGHLKFRQEALWKVILVSWGIAFFEYCFQVPANRIGADRFSPVQLKVIQKSSRWWSSPSSSPSTSASICAGTTPRPACAWWRRPSSPSTPGNVPQLSGIGIPQGPSG